MSNSARLTEQQAAQVPPTSGPVNTSVDNALWLLQLVGERPALRVAEAAELLGVGRSTAHRLLSSLRRRGFVVQDRPNGAYRPGPALYEMGLAAVSRIDIREVARPVLHLLRDETQETASLGVLDGVSLRFLDCVESQRSVRVGNRTGVVRPAHATALGKAVLASLPEAELARRYPNGKLPPAATSVAIADMETLQAELEETRRRGFAVNWDESAEGVSAIAVALHDIVGQPLASLGVSAPSSRIGTPDAMLKLAPAVTRGAELVRERLHLTR